jgi:hypothetical protein
MEREGTGEETWESSEKKYILLQFKVSHCGCRIALLIILRARGFIEKRKSKLSDMGCFKLNWNAAICSLTKKMGVGAVLRDEHGVVVAALAGAEPAPPSWGGQIEKKKLGGPKLEKIINFGVKF